MCTLHNKVLRLLCHYGVNKHQCKNYNLSRLKAPHVVSKKIQKNTRIKQILHTTSIWKNLECIYPFNNIGFLTINGIKSIQHVQPRNCKKCNCHPVVKQNESNHINHIYTNSHRSFSGLHKVPQQVTGVTRNHCLVAVFLHCWNYTGRRHIVSSAW